MNVLTALIIGGAFLVQALIGFGGGLLATPLLSLYMPVKDAVTLAMVFQFLMGLLIWSTRRDIQWVFLARMALPVMVGTLSGIWALAVIDGNVMRLTLAAFIAAYLANKHAPRRALQKALAPLHSVWPAGLCGGFFTGLIGMGAPIYIIHLKSEGQNERNFRANMMAVLFFGNLIRMPVSGLTGLLGSQTLSASLWAMPVFLLALWAGQRYHAIVPVKVMNFAIDGLLVCSALALFLKASAAAFT